MPFLCSSQLFIAYGSSLRIVVHKVNSDDVNDKEVIEVPAPPAPGAKKKKPEGDGVGENGDHGSALEDMDLHVGAFSPDSRLMAVADTKKRLFVWSTETWTLINTFSPERKLVRMTFDASSNMLLAADRSGDVHSYELKVDAFRKGSLLLGHLSMLLDVALTPSSKYIITSDRDEKIRISDYPNCYNIESYCLGHTEFVSSLCVLDDDLLLSGSGDGSLRLWSCPEGALLDTVICANNYSEASDRLAVRTISKISPTRVAATFFKANVVHLFTIDDRKIFFDREVKLQAEPTTISLTNDYIIVCTPKKSHSIAQIIGYDLVSCHKLSDGVLEETDNRIRKIIEEISKRAEDFCSATEKSYNSEEVDSLYKQYYDNINEYFERKKTREEAQKTKKQKVV